jgi:hypothetical protein
VLTAIRAVSQPKKRSFPGTLNFLLTKFQPGTYVAAHRDSHLAFSRVSKLQEDT